jgi:hypothetical protein
MIERRRLGHYLQFSMITVYDRNIEKCGRDETAGTVIVEMHAHVLFGCEVSQIWI